MAELGARQVEHVVDEVEQLAPGAADARQVSRCPR
jgi:hypothetical protein